MESKPRTVLLVEDELFLQIDLLDPLEEAGFVVLAETQGYSAIKTLETKASEIDALITDITLADHATGWEVARKARELNPGLPVIYTTSYNIETWAANGVPDSVLIQKPFLPLQLLTALAQLLNKTHTP